MWSGLIIGSLIGGFLLFATGFFRPLQTLMLALVAICTLAGPLVSAVRVGASSGEAGTLPEGWRKTSALRAAARPWILLVALGWMLFWRFVLPIGGEGWSRVVWAILGLGLASCGYWKMAQARRSQEPREAHGEGTHQD